MKTYSVSIWPNNQPPIFIGNYKANNKKEAIEAAEKENRVKSDENWCVEIKSEFSRINGWWK